MRNVAGPVALLAFCTRSLFELDVRLRHILISSENLNKWIAETASDRVDLLNAVIDMGEPDDPRVQILRGELERIGVLKAKYGLPHLRPVNKQVGTLAHEVGLESEYRSLFKIFSKFVHPTAYLVNSGNPTEEQQVRDVLTIHLQRYALDLLKRAADEMGIPEEITR